MCLLGRDEMAALQLVCSVWEQGSVSRPLCLLHHFFPHKVGGIVHPAPTDVPVQLFPPVDE